MQTTNRKRGVSHPFIKKTKDESVETVPAAADVPATKDAPMTLGAITKRETKDHRKRVLRKKIQKAKQ
jgi:hypothetical protein